MLQKRFTACTFIFLLSLISHSSLSYALSNPASLEKKDYPIGFEEVSNIIPLSPLIEEGGPCSFNLLDATADDIIAFFKLAPNVEGGYYNETFASKINVKPQGKGKKYKGKEAASTSIYYLLKNPDISVLHKLEADEVWNYISGSSITIVEISDKYPSSYKLTVLGNNICEGEVLQYVVKKRIWFGAFVTSSEENAYSFVTNVVAPGFTYENFTFAKRKKILRKYPEAAYYILKLTD